jgi:hypothetical protein
MGLAKVIGFYNFMVYKIKNNIMIRGFIKIHKFFHNILFSYPINLVRKINKYGMVSVFLTFFSRYIFPYTKFFWLNLILVFILLKNFSFKKAVLVFFRDFRNIKNLKYDLNFFDLYLEFFRFFKQGLKKHLILIYVKLNYLKKKIVLKKKVVLFNFYLKSITSFSFKMNKEKHIFMFFDFKIVLFFKWFDRFLIDFSELCKLLHYNLFFLILFGLIFYFLKLIFYLLFYL